MWNVYPPTELIQIKAVERSLAKIGQGAGRKRPMIFILDDDEGVRDSLRLLLKCEGLEAREFASCREFLDADGGAEGDCLILDVHMPGMSGIELLETIRRRGDMLPVIVLSGRIDTTTRNRACAAGALAVVEKPYQAEEVLDLVRLAMDQR
jgi:two-component system, LuxR family, response regulator FixJ